MAGNVSIDEIRRLSVTERILLVEDIWDSIADEADAVPLTDAQREELDARLARFKQDPSGGTDWDEIKAMLGRK